MSDSRFTVRQRHLVVGVTGLGQGDPDRVRCAAYDLRRPLPQEPQFTFTYREASAALHEARRQLPGLLRYAQLHRPVLRAAPVPPSPADRAAFTQLRRAFARRGERVPPHVHLYIDGPVITRAGPAGDLLSAALLADLNAHPALRLAAARHWPAQQDEWGTYHDVQFTPEGYPGGLSVLI